MQVGDDGKPRYDELVFPADGRGYFVIDTDPSVHTINKAKNETGVRLEIRTMITDLLRQSMDEARSWAEKIPLVSAEDPNKRRFECDVYEEPMGESEPDKQTQNAGSLTAASAAGDTVLDASSLPAAGGKNTPSIAPRPTVRGARPKSKAKVSP